MAVQCRCIVTWTGCVAAMVTALEGGHVLHTLTQTTLHSSAQVHGDSSQHQGGRVDGPQIVVVVTLQYSHQMEYSTTVFVVESLGISSDLLIIA